MRIVLVGPPGAGKGTQGELIARRLNVPRIVVGDLVPDHLVVGIVEQELEPHTSGFVLHGFPRSVTQSRMLDRFLGIRGAELDVALHFDVPDSVIAGRLVVRGRDDDTPAVIATRLDAFRAQEEALLAHYRGRVVEVDAVGGVDDVFERVLWGLRESLLAA